MITCYSLNGNIYDNGINFKDFKDIIDTLKSNWKILNLIPVQAIILIFDEYSRRLSRDKQLLKIEGVPYLSFYFKKSNLEKLINISLKDKKYLNEFVYEEDGKLIKAQGRGIACHWIAGNIDTLAFYSVFQAIIAKNSNLVRVPKKNIQIVARLLKCLDNIEVNYENKIYYSKDILKNICLIYFDSTDELLNKEMSFAADARIVWGGEEAVNYIVKLPKKTTCKDVIFGPKYSFAVFDKDIIEGYECQKYIEKFVMDIITFNQKACSSPQVLFVEKSSIPLEKTVKMIGKAFKKIEKRYKNIVDEATAARIINERGIYSLSLDKQIYCSKGLNYTILINNDIVLEEPVGGRCIFVKEVNSIFDVENLINRRIQTLGFAIKDKSKMLKFADMVTTLGVDRVVSVGIMNIYDSPWDGCFIVNELVRWCSINI